MQIADQLGYLRYFKETFRSTRQLQRMILQDYT